ASLGYRDPPQALSILSAFKESFALKKMTKKGAETLERMMPRLIEAVGRVDNPEDTLKRIMDLFEAVAGRNVYLSLLAENPDALQQLIKLSSASPWISDYLSRYPALFDELLDPRSLYEPLNKQDLRQRLENYLHSVDVDDFEQLMFALRRFKQINVLHVAAADIMDIIPIMVVSDYLTYIAEAILEQVVNHAWRLTVEKYGAPPGAGGEVKGFGVIGFGKLGGIEFGYGSDMDLVFLYDCEDGDALTDGYKPIACSQFYARFGQKVMTMLNTKMLSGVLYEVDMRLRPSGNSGLLVSHVDAYEDYMKKDAWTWEHQALVRGRFIAGDEAVRAHFDRIRRKTLCLPRNLETLKKDVREMREKMRENLAVTEKGRFDLKQSIGGIADIEFIVQFHILARAADHPDLVTYTDNVRLLEGLKKEGFISDEDERVLKQAYCAYRDRGHSETLQGKRVVIDEEEFTGLRSKVESIWRKMME
ncbi:MAG: bifunctional [glutamate--ammonia ligase]-adenylyl-L-tyrosine phosphorylase/[glutamate--ammonia-ligase] adenylyltransferase, partial [Gammaproteobacteria bacterium]